MQSALDDIRVIEYGHLVSAPYCTRLLAGLGAEVIKVEEPGTGDESRRHGPFPRNLPDAEQSGLFLSLNTNKLGITLNLKTNAGRDILKKLLEKADIFVENNPPAVMQDLGLTYAELEKINPALIMVSITPFGLSGPYKDYKAAEINCCAAGGISVGIGEPDREPLNMPLSQGAYQAGASAAIGILAALMAREKTGEGQLVDISEVEVWATLHMAQSALTFLYRGVTGIRRGIHGGFFLYPCSYLPCKDGYISFIAPQIDQWMRFLNLIGNPSWAEDPRYKDRRAMQEQYADETDALIIPWLKERTREELFQLCKQNQIPCSPIYSIAELINHTRFKERQFFNEIDHPRAGKLPYPKEPCNFSAMHWRVGKTAPLLGQDNEIILGQRLGYSLEKLSRMRSEGVI